MNWFDTSGLTSLAKSALKEAQKTIDKALDIQVESGEDQDEGSPSDTQAKPSPSEPGQSGAAKDNSDFFASWGLTVSAESEKDEPISEQPVVTESPSKSNPQSLWGSFAGSFFEHPKDDGTAIVRPPKAKSMNIISDAKYGSHDDLFSKSQLVMSDNAEKPESRIKEESVLDERRRSSTRSNRLSLVSSRNSSDSVEVLSQSLKTTPDSEPASGNSMSHSSSVGHKLNSESVEILPDSLVSPSSIECLGFDSCSSEIQSSQSSNMSLDGSDKKSSPLGDKTEKVETADSVSLVADDDEDTISYNSVSECTAPTVLDTDDKPVSPFSKPVRIEQRKVEMEFMHIEPLVPVKMQPSENSSNDGSWSDRTLNADNDSVTLENTAEEPKREVEVEDVLIEKLSDSSSFYDVNMGGEMLRSESSAFENVDKQHCNDSSESSRKSSVKERTSPISSDSKSDLVKIGSDRTSGHTSGDEETATSSDIEIIPSPNGESHGFCRNSPGKYVLKGRTSPNLVDLVLGKSLATKIRGHNRELSEASIQSNTSDESQNAENEKLLRRLCEMAEILEARENRLMEISRSNVELAENNADLKLQVESLLARHEAGDINMIAEDYTQRMSALEKKFQQAIREKDQLRKQLDQFKSESSTRKSLSDFENSLKEKDDIIAQMQEEGEKLARQQLQHSNIIKKLRGKEKDNEQVIKNLRDKIAEQSAELDRLKRAVAAKEELEVSQIEAVYRLTTSNKKLDAELAETKSALDDATQRLETSRTSLEAARRELAELQRGERVARVAERGLAAARDEAAAASARASELRAQLDALRVEKVHEEQRWAGRLEALREERDAHREHAARVEAAGGAGDEGGAAQGGAGVLLQQIAVLQSSMAERERAHERARAALSRSHAEIETSLAKALERERLSREENLQLQEQLSRLEESVRSERSERDSSERELLLLRERGEETEKLLLNATRELETLKAAHEAKVSELSNRVAELQHTLSEERACLITERKRNAILQEQINTRGDISPSHSIASESYSGSLWHEEAPCGGASLAPLSDVLARLSLAEGECRALREGAGAARREAHALRRALQAAHAALADAQSLQEQYDALLQMYGEAEERIAELKLDLQDVTQLYKSQLDELAMLRRGR